MSIDFESTDASKWHRISANMILKLPLSDSDSCLTVNLNELKQDTALFLTLETEKIKELEMS